MDAQWKAQWIKAVLSEVAKSPTKGEAAVVLGVSYPTLNRWLQGNFYQAPGEDKIARLAELKGEDVEAFRAWLKGQDYKPREGKSWAELGREAIENPAALDEFLSGLDELELLTVAEAANSKQRELLSKDR